MKFFNAFFTLSLLHVCFLIDFAYSDNEWPRDRAVDRNKLPYKVVCYWGTWAYYRPGGDGKFEAEHINPHLCTHINYGFAKLDAGNRIALYDPDLDVGDENWNSGLTWGHGMIRRMNDLRDHNPNLATLISIGGWNEGSDKYSVMVRNAASRKVFVDSVVAFLIKHRFDGLDFDWEYPAMRATGEADRVPGRDDDKQDYILLLRELRAAFEPYGFLLTAAVSAGPPTIDRAYDVPQVNQLLHFINLMTYDFHGGWDKTTAHNAPLYPSRNATGIDRDFTTQYAVDYWISKGADPKNIILGIPLYGRTFTLKNASENGLGAPVVGKGGNPGPITRIIGMLGYNEICSMVQNGWQDHWNDEQQIPYATFSNQWVGYDNIRSVQEKVNFLIERKLGGGMIWSIDTDDFSGHCGAGKYPLLKTISRTLNKIDGPDVKITRKPFTTARPNDSSKNWQTSTQTSSTRPPSTTMSTTQRPSTTASSTSVSNTLAPITTSSSPVQSTKLPSATSAITTITPTSSTPTTTTITPTQQPDKSFVCPGEGYFPDKMNPKVFHYCVNFGSFIKDHRLECAGASVYDRELHVCVHPKKKM